MITVENLAAEYAATKYITKPVLVEEEAKVHGKEIGDTITILPFPDSPQQAFERVQKLYAQLWSEGLQRAFVRAYPSIDPEIIESKLKEIDEFIEKAKKRKFDEAFKISITVGNYTGRDWLDIKNDKELEYLRLTKGGYYEVNMCDQASNSIAAQVYGQYVLFRQWLQKKLDIPNERPSQKAQVPQTSVPSTKQQNFLNEIAGIEREIGRHGAIINPKFYAPVRTLWDSISDKEIREIEELYREEIKAQVLFAKDMILKRFLAEYNTSVRQQPDKQESILKDHRDVYVNRLTEIYAPIRNWFYDFWDEEKQNVERIADLEQEVFHFCYMSNKPFWVGRTLLQRLYGYCLVVEEFNKTISNVSSPTSREAKSVRKKVEHIKDIWIGEEDEFWRIVKIYANKYIEQIDGKIIWAKQKGGISYLAGFTYECQQKGWIAKNLYSAPDFQRVYQNTFNISFDETKFKPNNIAYLESIYYDPFKSIPYKVR